MADKGAPAAGPLAVRVSGGWLVGLLLCSLFAGGALAARMPVEKCAPILIRALSYDRGLKSRAGPSVTLAVVYNPGIPSSLADADTALNAFKALESLRVNGLPFRAIALPYGPELSAKLEEQGIDVLFVVQGLSSQLEALVEVTRRRKVLTLTDDESGLRRGAAIGVVLADGKPTLMVNLPASTAEGAQLSSELLRLATIVR